MVGNDAVKFSTGVVADGYIRGAQISIDTGAGGIVVLTGVFTDATGSFILPSNAPAGAIVATGGFNIDTGLANTMTLKAPSGSSVINPLTTLVQDYVAANAAANGGAGVTTTAASAAVVAALGLAVGTNLTTYDPIAALAASAPGSVDPVALAVQHAAVQVAAIVSLAAASPNPAMTSAVAAETVFNSLTAQMGTVVAPLVVNLTDPAVISTALGTTSTASVQNIQATNIAIAAAADAPAIAAVQITALTLNAPLAPVVALTTDSGMSAQT